MGCVGVVSFGTKTQTGADQDNWNPTKHHTEAGAGREDPPFWA